MIQKAYVRGEHASTGPEVCEYLTGQNQSTGLSCFILYIQVQNSSTLQSSPQHISIRFETRSDYNSAKQHAAVEHEKKLPA